MAEQEQRKGREGGRWVNERPTSEEFASWFTTSMPIDDKLDVADYIGGVVLIPAVDSKAKVVTGFQNGKPLIDERPELSFIPYAKVETRIAYFWDLLDAYADEWVGIVAPVELPRPPVDLLAQAIDAIGAIEGPPVAEVLDKLLNVSRPSALTTMVNQLPPGFSIMSVPVGDGYSHFICSTIRVAIYRRADYEAHGEQAVPLREGRGTKQVPLVKSYNSRVWADDSSLMKAETGALGRALGFAGIFVIPGSGVATAEDMIEAAAQGAPPVSGAEAAGPQAPAEAPARTGAERSEDEETQLRTRAGSLFRVLSEEHPEKATEFGQWARTRNLTSLSDARGAMLKGVVKKLEKLTEEAEAVSQQAPEPEEAADVPAKEAGDDEPSGPAS